MATATTFNTVPIGIEFKLQLTVSGSSVPHYYGWSNADHITTSITDITSAPIITLDNDDKFIYVSYNGGTNYVVPIFDLPKGTGSGKDASYDSSIIANAITQYSYQSPTCTFTNFADDGLSATLACTPSFSYDSFAACSGYEGFWQYDSKVTDPSAFCPGYDTLGKILDFTALFVESEPPPASTSATTSSTSAGVCSVTVEVAVETTTVVLPPGSSAPPQTSSVSSSDNSNVFDGSTFACVPVTSTVTTTTESESQVTIFSLAQDWCLSRRIGNMDVKVSSKAELLQCRTGLST